MTTPEIPAPAPQPPIETVEDTGLQAPFFERLPAMAAQTENLAAQRLTRYNSGDAALQALEADGNVPASEFQTLYNLAAAIALTEKVHDLAGGITAERGSQVRATMSDQGIGQQTRDQIAHTADLFTQEMLVDYALDALQNWQRHLEGSGAPTFLTFATPQDAVVWANATRLIIERGDSVRSRDETVHVRTELARITRSLSELFLDHGKLGLGVAFGALSTEPGWDAELTSRLVEITRQKGSLKNTIEARNLYGELAHVLPPAILQQFMTQLPRPPLQLIPGARRQRSEHTNALFEEYQESRQITGYLGDHTPLRLPFGEYQRRTVHNYDLPREIIEVAPQLDVAFGDLSEEEQAAVARAMDLGDLQLIQPTGISQERGVPRYRQLVLDGARRTLHLARVLPDAPAIAPTLPGEHGYGAVESDLLGPVVTACGPVAVGNCVVLYNGLDSRRAHIPQHVPELFAPAEATNANAYWIAGTPRRVRGIDPGIMRVNEDGTQEPRFMILPVHYFHTEQDAGTALPAQRQ